MTTPVSILADETEVPSETQTTEKVEGTKEANVMTLLLNSENAERNSSGHSIVPEH